MPMRPFSMRFSRLIGQQQFDAAIDELRSGLKNDRSDASSLEMIALCHHWAGRRQEAIAAAQAALVYDPASFDTHALLAQLLAETDQTTEAAFHARRGLELYPEPLPQMPRFVATTFNLLKRVIPSLRSAPTPDEAVKSVEADRAEWYAWAQRYLEWSDKSHGGNIKPTRH